ncbi:hypothetical protein E2320_022605, partial [Naja naja]
MEWGEVCVCVCVCVWGEHSQGGVGLGLAGRSRHVCPLTFEPFNLTLLGWWEGLIWPRLATVQLPSLSLIAAASLWVPSIEQVGGCISAIRVQFPQSATRRCQDSLSALPSSSRFGFGFVFCKSNSRPQFFTWVQLESDLSRSQGERLFVEHKTRHPKNIWGIPTAVCFPHPPRLPAPPYSAPVAPSALNPNTPPPANQVSTRLRGGGFQVCFVAVTPPKLNPSPLLAPEPFVGYPGWHWGVQEEAVPMAGRGTGHVGEYGKTWGGFPNPAPPFSPPKPVGHAPCRDPDGGGLNEEARGGLVFWEVGGPQASFARRGGGFRAPHTSGDGRWRHTIRGEGP